MRAEKISFSLLSIETILELANYCVKTVSVKHSDNSLLNSSLENLKEPISRAILVIASDRKEELTEQINNADLQRDQAFIGFRKYIEVFQYKEWDPAAKQASSNLLAIIRKHGIQLYKEVLTVQSSLMHSLFEDLDTEKARLDIEKLGVGEWLAQLKRLQERFSNILQQRNEVESKKDIPTKAEAKAALVKNVSSLLDGLEFLAEAQSEKYIETNKLVNEIANRIIASNSGR